METDINIPKTKSVNIFFQYARMLFYLSVISNVLPTLTTSEVCSSCISHNFRRRNKVKQFEFQGFCGPHFIEWSFSSIYMA